MNKEKISEIISGIDDNFIEEAATPKRKKTAVYRYIGIAACVAVAVISGVFISQNEFITPPTVDTEETTNESGGGKNTQEISPAPEIVTEPAIEIVTESEMMISPHWSDLSTPQKYGEVTLNNITYSSQCCEISEGNILELISDAEMYGYDIYEDKTYTVNAKVYSIKNILQECAVAVRIGDEDKYYVYVNSWYTPDTLGDLIDALDLRNTLSFGKAYSDHTDNNTYVSLTFADFDDSIVWNMILDDTSVKNIEYDRFYDKIIGVSVDIPLLGYKNISLGVTKDGYIITNILSTQKCFFIGQEKAEAFGNYILENVPHKEMVTVTENPDGTIPGKGEEETAQSTPGYNPETDSAPPAVNSEAITPIPEDFIIEETTKS